MLSEDLRVFPAFCFQHHFEFFKYWAKWTLCYKTVRITPVLFFWLQMNMLHFLSPGEKRAKSSLQIPCGCAASLPAIAGFVPEPKTLSEDFCSDGFLLFLEWLRRQAYLWGRYLHSEHVFCTLCWTQTHFILAEISYCLSQQASERCPSVKPSKSLHILTQISQTCLTVCVKLLIQKTLWVPPQITNNLCDTHLAKDAGKNPDWASSVTVAWSHTVMPIMMRRTVVSFQVARWYQILLGCHVMLYWSTSCTACGGCSRCFVLFCKKSNLAPLWSGWACFPLRWYHTHLQTSKKQWFCKIRFKYDLMHFCLNCIWFIVILSPLKCPTFEAKTYKMFTFKNKYNM